MMSKRGPINPYLVGPPVKGSQGFYGRQDIVEKVINTLTNARQNTIVLHGQRRIGKSSLLYRIRRDEILLQDYLPIFLDMQLYEGFSPPRILANTAQLISSELGLSLSLPTETDLSADYNRFQRTFLPEISRYLEHKRILLLVDEFDVVVPPTISGVASADTLLGYLRTLITGDQEHLAFIFVVGQRLDLLNEGYQRLFKGAHTLPVGRLGETETYNLLTELGQVGQISYTDEALAEIWALTHGHPYLNQLIGFEIFDHLQKQETKQATPIDVTACLDRAMERGQGALDWFWGGFAPELQWVLAAVADLTDRQQSVSSDEIDKTLQQHLLFLTPSVLEDAYKYLREGDFLIETDRDHYQFAVEFIRQWIVKYHPLKEIQRQVEDMSPEALNYYQVGRRAFGRGNLAQAVENYQKALEHNPYFARVHLDLAVALRAQGQIPEAIAEYEEAYQLDPASAREDLIDLHLVYARQLQQATDDAGTLAQAWRILEINPDHQDARQLVSRIYLDQIEACLIDNDFARALDLAKKLVEPVPIIQEFAVSQQVRELWLAYSQKLTQQKPPNWAEAQLILDSLEPLDLLDETAKTTYNRVTLDKVRAFLKKDELDSALTTLQNELKLPLPAKDIKDLLLDYSHEQMMRECWSQADKTLKGLCQLVEGEDSQTAQLTFYHQWGDTLLKAEDFDEAIAVYRQGTNEDFQPKIANAYLLKATWHLDQHKLHEAKISYQQALATQNTKSIRGQARDKLETYFNTCRLDQAWAQAGEALKILQMLGLVEDDASALETSLHLDQAKAELAQGHLDSAFQHLTALGSEASVETKALVRTYIQQKARQREWTAGAAALKRLNKLLTNDSEAIAWHANWLFLWARHLFPEDKLDKQSVRAKVLCRKILALEVDEFPLLNLTTETDLTEQKGAPSLQRHTCILLADILLDQAQTCLYQSNLLEAHKLFEEVLTLPFPPKDLQQDIQNKLYTFSQQQTLKEIWGEAEDALKVAIELGVSAPEISQALDKMPTNRARLLLKADQPVKVFDIFSQQKTDVSDEERETIKTMVYQFSRLYAGRTRWAEAKQALRGLHNWSTQSDREIIRWLDDLNRERLDFIRGRRQPMSVPEAEMKRVEEEVQAAREGYEDSKSLELDTLGDWAEDFIRAGLALGQACLANDDLTSAIKAYKIILGVESRQTNHQDQVSQSLHNYGERMREQGNWEEAWQALAHLKSFNLVAPDGRTRPDPRVDGAIQRVILSQARAWLAEDLVSQTFIQLRKLPRPRPTGEVKEIIQSYNRTCRTQNDWENAIAALVGLVEFLDDDYQEARDQEALAWLVDGLEQWGQHVENAGTLTQAVEIYHEALGYNRKVADPHLRSPKLADHYIRVALQLAQNFLSDDPQESEIPPVITQAIQWYRHILELPEHQEEHERQVNEALYDHARKLATARQWPRAHQLLDNLNTLYPSPKDNYKTCFAIWRWDVAFDEVQTQLTEQQLTPAFDRLKQLKDWLNEYKAPQATWHDSEDQVKILVYQDFCQSWLGQQDWERATEALANLSCLIPSDRQIIGWEVDALYRWGQWLQGQNRLAEARDRYKQALEKAPNQTAVPQDQIEAYLLETQLAYAQSYLDQHELEDAVTIYREALQKPDDYLDRADKIRQALHDYSQLLVRQTPPAWAAAHQALSYLSDLDLNNHQVFSWHQTLILQEVEVRLQNDELDTAFVSLDTMERPWPLTDIQNIVQRYARQRVEGDTWQLALEALKCLGNAVGEDASARKWVAEELITLGELLDNQENFPGGQVAYQLALNFHNS